MYQFIFHDCITRVDWLQMYGLLRRHMRQLVAIVSLVKTHANYDNLDTLKNVYFKGVET